MSKLPKLYAVVYEGFGLAKTYTGVLQPFFEDKRGAENTALLYAGTSEVVEYLPATEAVSKERVRELMERHLQREQKYRKQGLWDMANRCEAQVNALHSLLKDE